MFLPVETCVVDALFPGGFEVALQVVFTSDPFSHLAHPAAEGSVKAKKGRVGVMMYGNRGNTDMVLISFFIFVG